MTDTRAFNLYTLLIICLVPLVINPFSADLYSHPKILFVYVISGVLIVYYFLKVKSKEFKTDLGEYALAVYFALVVISTLFSVDIHQSLVGAPNREEGLAAICCYILIYFICSKYYKFSYGHLKYLVISAFIISIYGMFQYYGIEPLQKVLGHTGAIATIGNRNFMGSYITLIMPISIFAFVYTNRHVYLFLSCTLYLCMLCAYTRSSWVAFVFYICLLAYFLHKYKLKASRLAKLILIFFCITVLFNFLNNNQTINRMLSIKNEAWSILTDSKDKDNAKSNRFFIWQRGIQLLKDRPLIGSGPDTFGIVFMEKFTEDVVTPGSGFIHIQKDEKGHVKSVNVEKIDKAHNEYLQIAVTMGIPSLICYLIFIGGITFKAKNSIKNNILIIPVFCSILGYLLQAFFNISVVGVAPVYWAILGITRNFSSVNSSLQESS
jgi:Lipid A core - O-antigen ligase and related enzymes